MKNNMKLIAALVLPIAVLFGMATYQQFLSATGGDHIVAIEGYDPTDLLSGSFIRFRIKYDTSRNCSLANGVVAYMCVKPDHHLMASDPGSTCEQWIEGRCRQNIFEDEINRFYIPEEKAKDIEREVLAGRAQIRLSVGKDSYVVKDLLINGKSWKDMP
jgi:uncharacterized membrane-anchored protein